LAVNSGIAWRNSLNEVPTTAPFAGASTDMAGLEIGATTVTLRVDTSLYMPVSVLRA